MRSALSRLVLASVLALPLAARAQGRGVPSDGFPSWSERMLQVLFNRSRADPNVDPKACSTTTARAPLLYHSNLNRSARFHSSNLSRTGCFQHDSPCLLFSDVSNRFPPLGTCDGSASCACSNTPACNSSCSASTCTLTFDRTALFGTRASAEIIASGGSPRSALNMWLDSSGHCSIILGSYGAVGAGVAGISTGNFVSSASAIPALVAGGHEGGSGFGQFTSSTAADVGFRVNYYHAGGAPRSAALNVDGTPTPMTLERGTPGNGTFLATVSLTSAQCRRYFFSFEDASGAVVRLPETGSYGVGGSLATCPDWEASGSAGGSPPTVATPAAASPSPSAGTSTTATVLGADDAGEAALAYTWSATGPAAVTFSPNATNAAKHTTATFAAVGTYVLTASIRDAGGLTATSAVTVTVNPTLTSLRVSPASATVAVGSTQAFTAEGRDQFGARLPSQPSFAFAVSGGGTIASTGVFTAGGAAGGPFTVTASSGAYSATAQVTVTAGAPPTVAAPAAASPSPSAGTSTTVTVLGADDGGEAALAYTWSATGPAAVTFSPNATNAAKHATATFAAVGSYALTASIRDAGGLTATSAVAVTVSPTLTSVRVSPAAATVAAGLTQRFEAEGRDQFGARLASQPSFAFAVSGGGTIASTGVFTAGSAAGGPFTVTASSDAVHGTATVSVTEQTGGAGTPVITVAATARPNPVVGSLATVTVTAQDDGGEAALTYAWRATGPATVSFAPNGSNAAKATTASFSASGDYTLTVTVTDADGKSAASVVSVPVSYVAPPVRDTTPPTVAILEPSTGTVVSGGRLAVRLEASDDRQLARIVVSVDGRLVRTLTGPPWALELDVEPLSAGAHVVTAQAADLEGNAADAEAVSFERAPPTAVTGASGCTVAAPEGARVGLSLLWLLAVCSGRRATRRPRPPAGHSADEPSSAAAKRGEPRRAPSRRRAAPARSRPGKRRRTSRPSAER